MGRIERVDLGIVRPTEYVIGFTYGESAEPRRINDDVISYLLWFHLHGQGNYLGHPTGKRHAGGIAVVDGHHRLVVRDLFGIEWDDFYLPENESDRMVKERFPYIPADALEVMNRNIQNRFNFVAPVVDALANFCISTIKALRNQYQHLVDINAASLFYDSNALRQSPTPPRYPCNVDFF